MPLRVVMMGTGTFALPAFQALITSPHDVMALVTQPDRTGRGHHHHVNELKDLALKNGINVLQPEKVNTADSLEQLRTLKADLFVVAAYGQILSAALLDIPRLGAINLHGSLLPKYRGAAPVQYAVLDGETESGVTIFQIEPKLDAGPILGVVKTPIGPDETSGQLHDRLAALAAPLTLEVLDGLETDSLKIQMQNPADVSLAPKIRKEQGLIDWTKSNAEIACHVRGMQPWPLPFTFLHSPNSKPQRMLILQVSSIELNEVKQLASRQPGDILQVSNRIFVKTGEAALEVKQLQPAGKRPMETSEFTRGHDLDGLHFGTEQHT